MGLQEVNKVRRRAIGILTACLIVLALGYFEVREMDYYFGPSLVATPAKVYLLYRRNPSLGPSTTAYLHESPDGVNWSGAQRLSFDPGSAQILGDKLYVIRGKHYSIYNMSYLTGKQEGDFWERSASFELDWTVGLALPDGEGLRLVGFEDTPEGKVRLREAVLLGSKVTELPHSVDIDNPRLTACMLDGDLYVVCNDEGGQTVSLRRKKDAKEWKILEAFPAKLGRFDCAGVAGEIHVVGAPAEFGSEFVHYRLGDDGSVKEQNRFTHDFKTMFGIVRPVSEVALAGRGEKLFLTARLGSVVVTSVWCDGTWMPLRTVNRIPLVTRAVIWGWLLGVLALSGVLVVTGFHLYKAKLGKLELPRTEPRSFEVASLWRRFVAFAIDGMIASVIILSVVLPGREVTGEMSILEVLGLWHPLILKMIFLSYFAIPEAIFGQTIGKWLLGIQVKTEGGYRAGVWAAVLRNLFKLFSFLLLVELIVVLYTGKGQRLGDLASETVVVKRQT